MRQSFKVSFYLRSNYENKEGKSPVMLRIFLGGAMSNLGSTKIFVDKAQWNSRTSRQKGRSSEALAVNASLDAISTSLHSLYHKYQDDQTISLDKLRSAYLGQIQEFSTFLPVFDKFIDDIRQRVGHTISKESLQKYSVLRRHFFEFLVHRYKRKDIGLMEFTPAIIQDFELYLTTVALCAYNTVVKKMKTLKTVIGELLSSAIISSKDEAMGIAVSLRQDEWERSPTTNKRLDSCLVLKYTVNYIGFGCLNL